MSNVPHIDDFGHSPADALPSVAEYMRKVARGIPDSDVGLELELWAVRLELAAHGVWQGWPEDQRTPDRRRLRPLEPREAKALLLVARFMRTVAERTPDSNLAGQLEMWSARLESAGRSAHPLAGRASQDRARLRRVK